MNDEFQKMRRALEQDRERVKGSQEQVLLLQREIEAQKVSATSTPTPRQAKRVVQTRAMPPRSHATPSRSAPGRSRPPRSPPATSRLQGETAQPDAPEDEDYDDDGDEILNSSSGVEGQVVSSALAAPFAELNDEIAELQRKNEVLETLVSERNAANAAAQETQRWRVPDGETSKEAMAAYEKRLRKERREAAAAAMRAVAAKQALEEELA